jgi:hypothetical protein
MRFPEAAFRSEDDSLQVELNPSLSCLRVSIEEWRYNNNKYNYIIIIIN